MRVVTFGTFDGLHEGHEYYLREAKRHGDYLIVVVARDETVREVKGALPENGEQQRLLAVQALPYVDEAHLGHPGYKHKILRELKPDVICLGYDQQAFTQKLSENFPDVRIVRLAPFHPERYKSSLMRSREGTQSPQLRESSHRR